MIEKKCTTDFEEEYEKLALLLEQGQFELLEEDLAAAGHSSTNFAAAGHDPADSAAGGRRPADLRLVYLMNDTVESFLVFRDAVLTGAYAAAASENYVDDASEYYAEEESRGTAEEAKGLWAVLSCTDDQVYSLIVHRGCHVFSIFFRTLELEIHLFNYGHTGHFWVDGWEDLRQLEFRIAVLHDKCVYLGDRYSTDGERRLASLAGFPPLNYCCYPAVPPEYLVPSAPEWELDPDALAEMETLAEEAGDQELGRALKRYGSFAGKIWDSSGKNGAETENHGEGNKSGLLTGICQAVRCWLSVRQARKIAKLLRRTEHTAVIDLLTVRLAEEAGRYPDRAFTAAEEAAFAPVRAAALCRKAELEAEGKYVELLTEEPFQYAKDSIEFKVYLMTRENAGGERRVRIESFQS